jgi:hypothetical protein
MEPLSRTLPFISPIRLYEMRALVLFFLITALTGLPGSASGQSEDTTSAADTTAQASGDWLVLPYASYEPKTRIAIGMVAGYYQPDRPGRIPSSVQSVVTLTQERQIVINIAPEFYLKNGRYRLAGEMEASRFPDTFFGIGGDTPSSAEEDFTSRYLTLEATGQKRIQTPLPGRFVLGPRLFVRLENMTEVEGGGQLETMPIAGGDGGRTIGVGLGALWDDRDNIYYPRDGHFLETSALWHSAAIGSDFTFGRYLADLRAYRSAGPVVFAGNVYAEGVTGTPAFQTLPLLGGSERMRGYLEGRYRDAVYWTTQDFNAPARRLYDQVGQLTPFIKYVRAA